MNRREALAAIASLPVVASGAVSLAPVVAEVAAPIAPAVPAVVGASGVVSIAFYFANGLGWTAQLDKPLYVDSIPEFAYQFAESSLGDFAASWTTSENGIASHHIATIPARP